jgi:hypothetical protein
MLRRQAGTDRPVAPGNDTARAMESRRHRGCFPTDRRPVTTDVLANALAPGGHRWAILCDRLRALASALSLTRRHASRPMLPILSSIIGRHGCKGHPGARIRPRGNFTPRLAWPFV